MSTDRYVDPDPRFAECPRCGAALRFIRRQDGGVYSCSTPKCEFTSSRDAVVESLVRELHRTSRLLEDLARVALPVLVEREVQARVCE
jgi:ssDNA-binding Zn-finger/Zn-ribbon topoisomerase 1